VSHSQDENFAATDFKDHRKRKTWQQIPPNVSGSRQCFHTGKEKRIFFNRLKPASQRVQKIEPQALLLIFIPAGGLRGFTFGFSQNPNSQGVDPFNDWRMRDTASRQSLAENRPASTAESRSSSSTAQAASLSESKSGGSRLSKSCLANAARSDSGKLKTRAIKSSVAFIPCSNRGQA
jgi:hypothetical protein